MKTLWQDLRYGVRVLLRQPGFALVAVLTLALGVGANTAIFTVVDAALLRSLPYAEPERLVHLWETKPQEEFSQREASYPDYLDWRGEGAEVFESIGGYTQGSFTLGAGDEAPERVEGAGVTASFFDVLGVKPALGRSFMDEDESVSAERTVILSHGLWQRRFGADAKVLGRQVKLNGVGFNIVGVMPASFSFAKVGDAEVWLPQRPTQMQRERRYFHWLQVVARLKPGVSLEAARNRLATVGARIAENEPQTHAGTGVRLVPLQEEVVGGLKPILFMLLGAVGLVLLIACVNVANLLLARSTARKREIAIRVALGASRARLIRQLLTESTVLAVAGGGLGLVLALWGVDLLVAAIPPSQLVFMPYLRGLTLNTGVLVFTSALSLTTGLLFGLTPALEASRPDVQASLKEGGRASGSKGANGLRGFLVVTEVALALMLLVGAGLMLKSLLRMLSVNPGFKTENLLTMNLTLPAVGYSEDSKAAGFYEQLLGRVGNLPGVKGAAGVSNLPLSGDGGTGTPQVVGRPQGESDATGESFLRTVSASYFDVMGVPVLKGRPLNERDRAGAQPVVLVNRTFAEHVFPGEDPLGRRITFRFTADLPPFEIVGVVGDEKVAGLDERTKPVIYFPYLQSPDSTMSLVIRTEADPDGLVSAVRGEVQALDRQVPLYSVTTMERLIADSAPTFMRRYPAYLVGIFAGVALLLAVVGIYGVISYAVGQRTREIAIRVALGAQRRDVLGMVLRQGMLLALAGVGLGLLGAFVLMRLLSSLFFDVSAADPSVYAAVSALLVAVALLACYIPARRATKVDPMVALRYE
jgi:putative ABC transport system permease protein